MKINILLIILLFNLFNLARATQAQDSQPKNVYRCILNNRIPTTVVDSYEENKTIELIIWESNFFQSSGWTPERRCQEVSARLQRFSDGGYLRYITTGKMNGYNVICVADPKQPIPGRCKKDGLLITLEPRDNPKEIRNQLFNIQSLRTTGGIRRGGIRRGGANNVPACPDPDHDILDLNQLLREECRPATEIEKDPKTDKVEPAKPPAPPNSSSMETDSFFW